MWAVDCRCCCFLRRLPPLPCHSCRPYCCRRNACPACCRRFCCCVQPRPTAIQPPLNHRAPCRPSQDYLSRSSGVPNDKFHKVVSLFRERCGARLHWGKAGWPEHAKCFDGGKEYPNTWGHFGCAVQVRAG